jgi:hypothetical protein
MQRGIERITVLLVYAGAVTGRAGGVSVQTPAAFGRYRFVRLGERAPRTSMYPR